MKITNDGFNYKLLKGENQRNHHRIHRARYIFRSISLFLSLTLILATLPLSAEKTPSPAPAKTAASPQGSAPMDPGWPRQKSSPVGQLVLYQPHIDEWKDFRVLTGRMAISLTLAGSKPRCPAWFMSKPGLMPTWKPT
jgi:hypothetical protein